MDPTLIQAAILGIIQGLTEFIPVSSSGHLQIIPYVLGWPNPSTELVLFAHFGTLLALLIFFRKKLWNYVKVIWLKLTTKELDKTQTSELNIVIKILVAAIPAGILGALLDSRISAFYDNGDPKISALLALTAMLIFGIVFLFIDQLVGKKVELQKLSFKKAVVIGLSQALAFFRGVSRSGITIITSRSLGLSKIDAAEFSFLISIPIIAGSSLLDFYEMTKMSAAEISSFLPTALVMGLFAFIFGLLAIKFLLNYLKNHSLRAFGWYRIAFAIIIAVIIFF